MFYRKLIASASLALLTAGPAFAQKPADDKTRTESLVREALEKFNAGLQAQGNSQIVPATDSAAVTVPLTLEEAVRRAEANNLDIAVERLNPQTFDLTLSGLRSVYNPVATSRYGRNDVVRLPTNLLNPGTPNISTMTYNVGMNQAIPWGGSSFAVTFNNQRIESSDSLTNFNPQFNSSMSLAFTQPLLRGFKMDNTRQQIQTTTIARDTADLNLKARTVNTLSAVRSAYWDYVYAIQATEVARQSLSLAQKLLSDNKVRVEVGTMAPMDVVQAEAEEAARQQALTTALSTMRTAELSLKRLIVGGTGDPLWSQHIDPTDRPGYDEVSIDVETAVRSALQQRTDLEVARNNLASSNVLMKSFHDQSLPALDLTTAFGGQGIGGIQAIRSGTGLDSVVLSTLPGGYSNALGTLFNHDYPNWNIFLNVSYPLGGNQAQAQTARQRLLIAQNQAQIRASELTVATEVTNAALQVTNNQEALTAARAAAQLAQKRLDAEMSRFEVGMSNNFQVVQAQRDLRDAQNSELRALLNYRKSLVEFDRVQQAGAR